jgi:hypothetical protein
MPPRQQGVFRASLLAFAGVLAMLALWILAAEIIRPDIPYFPANARDVVAAADHRGRAGMAASLGVIRGDLWASYAISLAADFLSNAKDTPNVQPADGADDAGATAIKAARLAPADSRIWLLMAIINARLDGIGRGILEPLKMSYYTGPNDAVLIPLRLAVTTRSTAIADPELQDLARREIRTVVIRRPDLRPALSAAYHEASPEGRRFIETEVGNLDRNLLTAIRAGDPAH